MEDGGRYYVGQKFEETPKENSGGSLRGTSLCVYGLERFALTEI